MNTLSTTVLRPEISLDPSRRHPTSSPMHVRPRIASTSNNIHPPFFGANYTTVLSQSFNCRFSPVACEDDPPLPLALYIEHVVRAAGLPFEASIASLIILQRMYMHLVPEIFELRRDFSPHRLFVCAYVLAAKQREQLRNTADPNADRGTNHGGREHSGDSIFHLNDPQQGPSLATTLRIPINPSLRMSDAYWAQITGYTHEELENMQRQLLCTLGRNVVVFQIHRRQDREYAEKLEGCPLMRGLPLDEQPTLRNLARMTTEEHYAYFSNMGSIAAFDPFQGAGQPSRREICMWWQNRSKSYP